LKAWVHAGICAARGSGACALVLVLVLACAWALPVYATAQSASADGAASKTTTKKTTAKKTTGSTSTSKSSSAKSKATAGQSHAKSSAKSRSGVHSASGKSTRSTAASRKGKKTTAKVRGQKKIDSDRAQAIQEALIREHYLNGEATGTWNQASEDAMRKYQADQGWQSKQVPDSRALIKLGLGPSHDHLLNPESAMTTGPDAPRASSLVPESHTGDPSSGSGAKPVASDPGPGKISDDNSTPQ
jgi:hypothetical protein